MYSDCASDFTEGFADLDGCGVGWTVLGRVGAFGQIASSRFTCQSPGIVESLRFVLRNDSENNVHCEI